MKGKKPPVRFGSVCSGIEAASVAWLPLGWECAFHAEIDPFPCAVLNHRFPHVPNLGDFTKIDGCQSINVLVGGTPCQSFSVAGRRAGLDDPRGNLAIELLRLARRLRPDWLVWENVPGILSSRGGRDLGAFLGLLGELGYGWGYRVLDAQYVRVDGLGRAVPQRRRRVFVVGHLGDWRPPVAVLFDRESLSGHPPPRRSAGSDAARALTAPAGSGYRLLSDGQETMVPYNIIGTGHTSQRHAYETDVSGCLQHKGLCPTGNEAATVIAQHARIRRLTPREAERLQGFPDDWTLVPHRGKLAKDKPRYKAIGNSMAVNVMRWIGMRIDMIQAITHANRAASPGGPSGRAGREGARHG